MTNKAIDVVWLLRKHMPEVIDIEGQSVEFPWSEEEFVRCLRGRNCIGKVVVLDEQVVGFMIYELHETRLQVLNFGVHTDFRRRGVGRELFRKLALKLSHDRRTRILLEIRETALDAQIFLRSIGFRAVSVLWGHFKDSGEDAYVMLMGISPAEGASPKHCEAALPGIEARST